MCSDCLNNSDQDGPIMEAEVESTTAFPDSVTSCTTSSGVSGQCVTVEECFPYAFFNGGKSEMTSALLELIRNNTEPCSIDKSVEDGMMQ